MLDRTFVMSLLTTTAVAGLVLATKQAAAEGAPANSDAIEEVVVTAQKKAENLEKAALAVDVVSAAQLTARGVVDLRDVQAFLPSVRLQTETIDTEVYIRGVGGTNDIAMIDPPNAFNVNGAYLQREATGQTLYDVAQVEEVPGPQSTLYGRSALGGTVNVTTNRPTQNYETLGDFEIGNYDLLHLTAVENVPVSDTLAVRMAATKVYHSGYETSGAQSRDEYGVRLSVLYTPVDNLTAFLWGSFDSQQGHEVNGVNVGRNANGQICNGCYLTSNPWNDILPAADQIFSGAFGPIRPGNLVYRAGTYGGQVDYRFDDDLTLTYIPSYTILNSHDNYFLTALPFYYSNISNNESQELRLANDSSARFKWLTGLYAYKFDAQSPNYVAGTDIYNGVNSSEYGSALFGQATYSILDDLRLTAGGRVAYEHRRVSATDPVEGPFQDTRSFRDATFKLGVDYDLTSTSLLYADVQSGYQPGTFNVFASTPTTSNYVEPSRLLAYSVGSKNTFFDGKVIVNDEFFYYIYKDLVVSAFNPSLSVNSQIFNAQKILTYGDELNLKYKFTPEDRFDITVGYLHARNNKFVTAFPVEGQTNFDGLSLQYAPDWTVGAGYQHTFSLEKGELVASINTYFESQFAIDFYHTPGGDQPGYTKTDLSLTYFPPSGQWSFGVWIKNIENAAVESAAGDGGIPGPAITLPQPPRTFGIKGTFDF